MRILCTSYEYPPIGGGGAAACRGLAEALVSLGHDVDVVTSRMQNLAAFEVKNGVRLHRVACLRRHLHYTTTPELLTQLLPAYRRALKLSRKGQFEINHTHFIFPTGLTSYLLWRKTNLPYVITAHGSDVPGYNPDRFNLTHLLLQPIWKKIVHAARCIVTPSRFLKKLIEQRVDVRVELVPYGIDFPSLPNRAKRNRILVVTRMFERKGVQYLLKALQNVTTTDWEIFIAGDGPYLPELRKLAEDIPCQINFQGFVQGERLWDLYQSARVFVFPSTHENFPVVLLEAMHAGCAVITTSGSGCSEVVGDAAITVRPGNVQELGEALNRVLASEEEIERLGRLARDRSATFSAKAVALTHEDVFSRHAQ